MYTMGRPIQHFSCYFLHNFWINGQIWKIYLSFFLFMKILPFPLIFCSQKPLQSTQHPKKWVVRHKNRPNPPYGSKVTFIFTFAFCSIPYYVFLVSNWNRESREIAILVSWFRCFQKAGKSRCLVHRLQSVSFFDYFPFPRFTVFAYKCCCFIFAI